MNSAARNITIFLMILFFAGYFAYQARGYFNGSEITVYEPRDGDIVLSSDVAVKGRVKNTSKIFMNGRDIFADENGYFSEDLLLARGYNIIQITVLDVFGREKSKRINLILE